MDIATPTQNTTNGIFLKIIKNQRRTEKKSLRKTENRIKVCEKSNIVDGKIYSKNSWRLKIVRGQN